MDGRNLSELVPARSHTKHTQCVRSNRGWRLARNCCKNELCNHTDILWKGNTQNVFWTPCGVHTAQHVILVHILTFHLYVSVLFQQFTLSLTPLSTTLEDHKAGFIYWLISAQFESWLGNQLAELLQGQYLKKAMITSPQKSHISSVMIILTHQYISRGPLCDFCSEVIHFEYA
jgi:hypothetical protein